MTLTSFNVMTGVMSILTRTSFCLSDLAEGQLFGCSQLTSGLTLA